MYTIRDQVISASRAGSKASVRMGATFHASGLSKSVRKPRTNMGRMEYEEVNGSRVGSWRIFVEDKNNFCADYIL